eukprot:5414061-Prorocentrum_lima.AAC.1
MDAESMPEPTERPSAMLAPTPKFGVVEGPRVLVRMGGICTGALRSSWLPHTVALEREAGGNCLA